MHDFTFLQRVGYRLANKPTTRKATPALKTTQLTVSIGVCTYTEPTVLVEETQFMIGAKLGHMTSRAGEGRDPKYGPFSACVPHHGYSELSANQRSLIALVRVAPTPRRAVDDA
jgi:hypothetical protein